MMKSQSCFPKEGRKDLTTAAGILGCRGHRGNNIINPLSTARKTGVVKYMLSERNKLLFTDEGESHLLLV